MRLFRGTIGRTSPVPVFITVPVWGTIPDVNINVGDAITINLNDYISSTGGDTSITFSVVSGTLPAGITLNANGTLSGTTSEAATPIIVYSATNSAGIAVPNAGHTITVSAVVASFVNAGYTPAGTNANNATANPVTIPLGDGVPDTYLTQLATETDFASGGWNNESYIRFHPNYTDPATEDECYATISSINNLHVVNASTQIVVEHMLRIGSTLRQQINETRHKFKNMIATGDGGNRLLSEIQSSEAAPVGASDFFIPTGKDTLGIYYTQVGDDKLYTPSAAPYPAGQGPNLCDPAYLGEWIYVAWTCDIATNTERLYLWTQDGVYSGLNIECVNASWDTFTATQWENVALIGYTGRGMKTNGAGDNDNAYIDLQRVTVTTGTTTPVGPPAGFVV